MTAEELRELQDRGRFFYEMFPGAAAAEEWKRQREQAEDQFDEESRQAGRRSENDLAVPDGVPANRTSGER